MVRYASAGEPRAAFPVQVTFREVLASPSLEQQIQERAAKLGAFHPRIQSCRVVVEVPQKHKHQGKLYNLRIELTLPDGAVEVNRHAREDVRVALRDAFDAARRQLEDHRRVDRGDVKRHEVPWHGRVARVFPEEGFGFIETSDGGELYFARENLVTPAISRLREGDEVQFIAEAGDEGLQAKRVTAAKHHVPG